MSRFIVFLIVVYAIAYTIYLFAIVGTQNPICIFANDPITCAQISKMKDK